MKLSTLVVSVFLSKFQPLYAQECDITGRCDKNNRCPTWKDEGHCEKSKDFMALHCSVTCKNYTRTTSVNSKNNSSSTTEVLSAPPKPKCEDRHAHCSVWAGYGECEANPTDMHVYCAKSCGICVAEEETPKEESKADAQNATIETSKEEGGPNQNEKASDKGQEEEEYEIDPNCQDIGEHCKYWTEKGECQKSEAYMSINCARSCGTCPRKMPPHLAEKYDAMMEKIKDYGIAQEVQGSYRDATYSLIEESLEYLESEKLMKLPRAVRENCKNLNESCSFWAATGECNKSSAYMLLNCAVACKTCHEMDVASVCPLLTHRVPAVLSGDLNTMFERIVSNAPGNRDLTDTERELLLQTNTTAYTVQALSRPSSLPISEISVVVDKSLSPWIVVLDDFMTPEECDNMVELGYKYVYKASPEVKSDASDKPQRASRQNTESTSWCSTRQGCRNEELPQKLYQRIADVLGVPANYSEDIQLNKYEKGEFYGLRHDFSPKQKDLQCGPRILTFLVYLNDVEGGGGTYFPQGDITVPPKKGRALLWPSILNADPMSRDKRMVYKPLDVTAGVKYAANIWVHLYDYAGPQEKGCI